MLVLEIGFELLSECVERSGLTYIIRQIIPMFGASLTKLRPKCSEELYTEVAKLIKKIG